MVFHFFRKRDIVLPPPMRAASKTGREADGQRGRLERVAGPTREAFKSTPGGRASSSSSARDAVRYETVRRTGMSKPTVWRRRDRFLAEGVDGLPRDATRPPGKKPIAEDRVKAATGLAMSPPGIVGVRAPSLDGSGAGGEDGDGRVHHARHFEGERPRAAPGEDVQGLARPEVRDQGPRRCPVRGREDAEIGAGTRAEAASDDINIEVIAVPDGVLDDC